MGKGMKPQPLSSTHLHTLQRDTFNYFIHETNIQNGLVPDSTRKGSHSSIAAIGLGLASYPIGVQRKFINREEAAERVLATLRFFWGSEQSSAPNATGYKGFYYHFLHMDTGRRAWECELSTIDTAILIAGMLSCATYFNYDSEEEHEIRKLADDLYRRVDWRWAVNKNGKICMAWKPESGFFRTPGKATTKQSYFTSLAWLLRLFRCRVKPMKRLYPLMDGKKSTGKSFSMLDHCLSINFLTCGSTFAEYKTNSCERRELTISRTAAGQLSYSGSTVFETLVNSEAITKTPGELQHPMVLVLQC